jgi:hypothetical protein
MRGRYQPPRRRLGPAGSQSATLQITGSGLYDSYLCLEYSVTPTPEPLRGCTDWQEGDQAGVAIDKGRHLYRDCHSSYRTSHDGSQVLGALRIGPAAWRGLGPVRILFAPLAHTPLLHGNLCELLVIIDRVGVRSATIRSG